MSENSQVSDLDSFLLSEEVLFVLWSKLAVRLPDRPALSSSSLFLGNGQLIWPGDLTLGGCSALSITGDVLLFQAELQSCGSWMTVPASVSEQQPCTKSL